MVKLLVESGADVNHQMGNGRTALFAAADSSSLNIFRYLLEHGADVSIRDNKGETALIVSKYSTYATSDIKSAIEAAIKR